MPRPATLTAGKPARVTAGKSAASAGSRNARARTGKRTAPRGVAFAICTYLASGYTDAETARWCRPEFEVTAEQAARYRRSHREEIAALREQMHEDATRAGIAVPQERLLRLNRLAAHLEARLQEGDHRDCALLVARYLDLLKLVAKQSGEGEGRPLRAEASQGGLSEERQEYALSGERYQAAFRALARAAAALGGVGAANRPAD